jgi:hypothetical protein
MLKSVVNPEGMYVLLSSPSAEVFAWNRENLYYGRKSVWKLCSPTFIKQMRKDVRGMNGQIPYQGMPNNLININTKFRRRDTHLLAPCINNSNLSLALAETNSFFLCLNFCSYAPFRR